MATQAIEKEATAQSSEWDQKVQKLREAYADAGELSNAALENVLREIQANKFGSASKAVAKPETSMESAGRIGARLGKVSELTVIAPLREGGARRMRAFFETLHTTVGNEAVDRVGTVHNMRFVLLDNDTKLLFASAYDGDWDPYIDDFGTKIPDILDLQFGEIDGWPGAHSPELKDFIVKYQVPAYFWYVANPELTVVEEKRLQKIGKAADEFLDNVG